MKKFLVLLIILLSLVGFSVISFAVDPSSLNYVIEVDGHYELKTPIKTSTFTGADLTFWNDFMDAYSGKSSYVPVVTYNRISNATIFRFFLLAPQKYMLKRNHSDDSIGLSGHLDSFRMLSISVSTGSIYEHASVEPIYSGYLISQLPSFYVFYGKSQLCSNWKLGADSYANDYVKYVYWNKPFKFTTDKDIQAVKHRLNVYYQYSDGTQAFETYTNTFSEKDSFSISSPSLDGFKASVAIISGQMGNTDLNYTVTYTPISHCITINYQYEDGSKALEDYSGTFSKGQSYSIPTPTIKGYIPSLNIISGEMGTSDLFYTVIFTKIKETDSSSSSSSSSGGNSSSSGSSGNSGGNSGSSGSSGNSSGNSGSSGSGSTSNGNTKEDYIAFDSETIADSIDLFRNNLKPITNIALYGMLVLISIFAALEIIHKIAL